MASLQRVYGYKFADIHDAYIYKVERKGRTRAELDEILTWLTGYSQDQLDAVLGTDTDLETFFAEAPELNAARSEIKGVICGVRLEEIEDPLMREIRYMDKVVDELAKGKAIEKIQRALPVG
jgi:hypothetical protein